MAAYLGWMTQAEAIDFSNDDVWALWKPPIEAVRPKGKTAPQDLRRTLSAIVWHHTNGTKWRSVTAELGLWWRAAQLSIRWSKLGVWQRLLDLCQEKGLSLGLVHLDGTLIRAHQKAAGAETYGPPRRQVVSQGQLDLSAQTYPAFRRAVGQDGEPRVLVPLKGTASSAIFREGFQDAG